MAQSGIILKNRLGLSNFKYVLMTRVLLTSTYKIYLIFFDSRWPNTPLTSARCLRDPMPSMLYYYPFEEKPKLTPMFSIEDYGGDLKTSLFFLIDMAGYLGQPKLRSRVIENIDNNSNNKYLYFLKSVNGIQSLIEGLTIPDIKSNAVSSRNKSFLKKRRSEGESTINLEDVQWDEKENIINLVWSVTPTYTPTVTNYTPDLKPYKANDYIVEIEFENVSKYLGNKKDFSEFSPYERGKLVLDMLDNAEVKIWSSDPSWLFQSSYEYFNELGASKYPYQGPAGKDIWASRHSGTKIEGLHVTKHVLQILEYIKGNYSVIAKKLV